MKVSGHGGFWVLGDNDVNVVMHNAEYELDIESVNDNVTTSGSDGWAEGLPILCKLNSAVMRVPDDTDAYAEAMGLEEGAVFQDVWFKRGADTKYDRLQGGIVRSVRHVNGQEQARRLEVTLEYGKFTRNVSAPSIT